MEVDVDPTIAGIVWTDACAWFALAAVPTVLLTAVTNTVSVDLAPFPLLWVIPLGLYLLSFIVCFEHHRWYRARVFQAALLAGVIVALCR
jgi:hypothetical protein